MRDDEPGRFVDELREPLAALPHYFGAQIPYDHRSRRLPFGPAVTLVRGSLLRILRGWLLSALERQDRVNRLLVRALEQLDERSPRAFDERLTILEETGRARDSDERTEVLESTAIAQAFATGERFAGAETATIIDLLRARPRVLVADLSWPALTDALTTSGVGVQTVDAQRDAEVHVRALADASLDGAVLVGSPLQVSLGRVVVLLRQLRRVLAADAPLVIVVPNADSVSVAARDVWRDPAARRPVPPSLYVQIAEHAGLRAPEIRTLRAGARALSEDVGDPAVASNMRLLNEVLFGPEICAVIARK
jgi:hypothetical protein